MSRVRLFLGACVLFAAILLYRHTVHPSRVSAPNKAAQVSEKTQSATEKGFNASRYSLTDPASIWVVANKLRPLSTLSYAPNDLVTPHVPLRVPGNESMQLRKEASSALEAMFEASERDGAAMMLSSGYRSYSYQVSLYGGYVQKNGQAEADKVSARPGYSEHQTGLAADVEPADQQCDVEVCFADLPAGKWVAAHAWEYGFILRYPADKTAVTGYSYEPWHLRYVGKDLAKELHDTHTETLEEFFKLPAAPDYKH
jgi:D-alanyl-D-alanine carboxypeptidase